MEMDHKSILRTYLLKILLPCELNRLGNTSSIRTLQKRMLVKWSREEKLSCVQCAACRRSPAALGTDDGNIFLVTRTQVVIEKFVGLDQSKILVYDIWWFFYRHTASMTRE